MTDYVENQININILSNQCKNNVNDYKAKLLNFLSLYSFPYIEDKINTNNVVYQYLQSNNNINISEFCEKLVKTNHIKYISSDLDDEKNRHLFLAGVAFFVDKLNNLTNVFNNIIKTRDDIKKYEDIINILSTKQIKSINLFKSDIFSSINTLMGFLE